MINRIVSSGQKAVTPAVVNVLNVTRQPVMSKLERVPGKDFVTIKSKLPQISQAAQKAISELKLTGELKQLVEDLQHNENFDIILKKINKNQTNESSNTLLLSCMNEYFRDKRNSLFIIASALVTRMEKGIINTVNADISIGKNVKPVNPITMWLKDNGISNPDKLKPRERFNIVSKYLNASPGNKKQLIHDLHRNYCKGYFNSDSFDEYLGEIANPKIKDSSKVFEDFEDIFKDSKYFEAIKPLINPNNCSGKELKVNNMFLVSINELVKDLCYKGEALTDRFIRDIKVREGATKTLERVFAISEASDYDKIFGKTFSDYFKNNLKLDPAKETSRKLLYGLRKAARNNPEPAQILAAGYLNNIVPKMMDKYFQHIIIPLQTKSKKV